MAQDPKIMAAAWRRFSADRETRRAALERLTDEVYRRLPRVESIDRELRRTLGEIMVAAFEADEDPGPALREMEKQNLALQRERAERLPPGRDRLPVPDELLRQGAEPAAEQAAGPGRTELRYLLL